MELSPNEAFRVLDSHLNAFHMFPKKAWECYQTLPPEILLRFSKRTRASAIHDFMLSEAVKYADCTDGIRWFEVNQLYGLVVDECIAIRLKKFDSRKIPSNSRTRQVVNFRSQSHIDGIDAIHHLEIGYNLDSLEKDISEISLVYPSGFKSNFWAFEITESQAKPVVMDIFGDHSDDIIQPAIIKPKPGAIILPFRKKGGGDFSDDDNKW